MEYDMIVVQRHHVTLLFDVWRLGSLLEAPTAMRGLRAIHVVAHFQASADMGTENMHRIDCSRASVSPVQMREQLTRRTQIFIPG